MTNINRTSRPGSRILYILVAYIIAIFIFTLFRLINTAVYCASHHPDLEGLYHKSLVMGFRFDTLIACFVLSLPLLMVLIGELTHIRAKAYYATAHHITVTLFIICFFGCAADIPYFSYFFTHLNAFAVDWGGQAGTVVSMIFSEFSYVAFFFLFVAIATGYWFLMRFVYRRLMKPSPRCFLSLGIAIPVALVLVLACLLGMRGRITKKSPMRVGTAYFCNNAFLNQIGLNPVFTLMKSLEDRNKNTSDVQLIDKKEAEAIIAAFEQQRVSSLPSLTDTIALPANTNIILVLMESMSAYKVGFLNHESNLTPNLDTLMRHSLSFINAYSAGIHTHNGIVATLYGYPAILTQHLMKRAIIYQMCGLPHALSAQGYQTRFFVPHDSEWDNMKGFLMANEIQRLIAEKDYDPKKVIGTWGVPDHVMFDKAIEELSGINPSQPFFATCLTCSDHGPYIIPKDIELTTHHDDVKQQIVEYADWAIGRFMKMASKQPWFNNTLFIFVADHGGPTNSIYDISLTHNHIPLFFYMPGQIRPQQIDRMAQQIDICATTIGMLPFEWNNQTLGIDLMRQERAYAFFGADDKIGVLDHDWFYVYRVPEKRTSLYHYTDNDPKDHIAEQPERAEAMRRYGLSLTQHAQTLLHEGLSHCQ